MYAQLQPQQVQKQQQQVKTLLADKPKVDLSVYARGMIQLAMRSK